MFKQAEKLILLLVITSLSLMAISFAMGANARAISNVTTFFAIDGLASAKVFSLLTALLFAIPTVFAALSLSNSKFKKHLAYSLIALASLPLISLLSDARWIASLGGFPAIGSGQGVIKYFALIALAYFFLVGKNTKAVLVANYFPVFLVLLWIGGMKFTELEAKGIEDLVANSPLMFWLYHFFDVQTTSDLIGVYDIIALILLGLGLKYKAFLMPGILMSGAVFVVTQTFLFTTPGAFSADTLITGTGQFLIKDLWYIANLAVIYVCCQEEQEIND